MSGQMAKAMESDGLVDAAGKPVGSAAKKLPCRCGAPASERVDDRGFGPNVRELCGRCGFDFGVKA